MIVLILLLTGSTIWLLHLRSRGQEKAVAPPSGMTPINAPEKTIAVLPFENLSSDKANAYFADGIQDEILTRLSKIADLRVVSRTSTEHYKSAPENLPKIATQLGVANILEGSVQKSGDAVRVNVQLIKAANDSHLWADTFDRKLTDIFSVESEVAKAIADQLRAKLTGREAQVIAAKPTDNPEAYDAYLRGLAYIRKTSFAPDNTLNAQRYLKQAVRLDPKFAPAWALLSYVDSGGYITTFLQPSVSLREEAHQAADTALTLQPDLGEGLLAMGCYYYACLKDYDTAEHYFERARQLLPNSGTTNCSHMLLAGDGEVDRSSEVRFDAAERLDLGEILLTYASVSMRFPISTKGVSMRPNASSTRFWISCRMILTLLPPREQSRRQRAICREPQRFLVRCTRRQGILSRLRGRFIRLLLERRPAQIIPRLKEFVAQPDPALGYFNGELRFWLGGARHRRRPCGRPGNVARGARELEHSLDEQPVGSISDRRSRP